MTGDSISHSYQYLTPRERLPLLIAAARRGDAVDKQRLETSTLKNTWKMPEYYPHAEALSETAHYHLLTLLDLGMHFWQWWGLWLTRGLRNQAADSLRSRRGAQAKAEKELEHRAGCLVRYFAARFVAHVDGWKQFSTELHIEPEALLHFMIGWDNVVRTESRARELAFTSEEALQFVRLETLPVDGDESRQSGPEPVETAAEIAQVWHALWAKLIAQQGGS
jgi:hypothetical protein